MFRWLLKMCDRYGMRCAIKRIQDWEESKDNIAMEMAIKKLDTYHAINRAGYLIENRDNSVLRFFPYDNRFDAIQFIYEEYYK